MSGAIATLCATSTIGAAAAGLTFGTPTDNSQTQSSAGWPTSPVTPRSLPLDHQTPPRPMSCFGPTSGARHHNFSRPITATDPRRPSVHDSGRSSVAHEQKALDTSGQQRTPSSTFSFSAPSPISADEKTTTHIYSDNSATPIASTRPPKSRRSIDEGPLPPNKLIKRAYSQRGHNSEPPPLRRPATSHQRAASHQAFSLPSLRPSSSGKPFKHFLNVFQLRDSGQGSGTRGLGIRLIRPNGSAPTLLSGNVVEPAKVSNGFAAVQSCFDIASSDAASPSTPRSFLSFSSAPNSATSVSQSTEKPKRNLSFMQKLRNTSEPHMKLRGRFGKRVSSAPVESQDLVMKEQVASPMDEGRFGNGLGKGSTTRHLVEGEHAQGLGYDQGRISGQVQDRQTMSGHGNGMGHDMVEDRGQANGRGMMIKRGQTNESSSPVTPTSFSYRPNSRPHRPSSTPSSDLTSSRPGSEGAPRVFSWADDGDSIQTSSDTIYDSIRTGTARSTTNYPKPGLATLFDQSTTSLVVDSSTALDTAADALQTAKSPTLNGDNTDTKFVSVATTAGEDFDEDWDTFDDSVLPGLSATRTPPSQSAAVQKLLLTDAEALIGALQRDTTLRNSVFDWSEQPFDRDQDDETPTRPKTVHGRKQPDVRGSRATARVPSGMHTRSQSVPVLQETSGKKSDAFQKWDSFGVNSMRNKEKATEDWDDDFADEPSEIISEKMDTTPDVQQSRSTLIVPENIQKQQNNVLANIGYLREWGLAIEELKELKMRIAAEGVSRELNADLFNQVDAMIDLADQEAEDDGPNSLRSPASSVNFSDDGLDTPPPSESAKTRSRLSPSEMLRVLQRPKVANVSPRVDSPEPFTRPRKDSEAVAKTVIDALQHWRKPTDSTNTGGKKQKKVPFDTATLKDIVPYVGNLVRQFKEILREVEGLNNSPLQQRHQADPAFLRKFDHPRDESPSASREHRLKLDRAANASTPMSPSEEKGLLAQLEMMTVS